VIIRRAVDTPQEREQIERLALHFSLMEPYRALFNASGRRGLAPLIGIAVVELPNLITGDLYAEEVAWWVEPNRRGLRLGPQLIAVAEEWATTRGLRSIKMVAPIPSQVGRYYERRGYVALETAYLKVL
jgi:GNAT superfamily N-acetyltransferase